MGIIYIPIHKQERIIMKNTYGRNTDVNTTAEQFKLITDKKDEPDLQSAQLFVGGYVECVSFPNGDNDDYCDSMTLALMRFRRGGFISLHGEDTQDDEWRPRKREYY